MPLTADRRQSRLSSEVKVVETEYGVIAMESGAYGFLESSSDLASWCYDAVMSKGEDLPDPEQRHDSIAATPGVCGGRARIAGTRMRVSQIASEHEHLGMTPDEIVAAHPHLTLAGVHAALAYYDTHRDEIRAEWREADDLIGTMREQYATLSAGKRRSP